MTTKREKGNAFQRWIKAWLEEKGWTVHNQAPQGKMIRSNIGRPIFISVRNDIFGMDIIAKRMNKTLWIQATLDTGKTRKLDEILKYPWSIHDDVQIWMKRKTGIIDIFKLDIQANELIPLGKIMRRIFYVLPGWPYGYE